MTTEKSEQTNPQSGQIGATGLEELEMGAARIQVDDKKIINLQDFSNNNYIKFFHRYLCSYLSCFT